MRFDLMDIQDVCDRCADEEPNTPSIEVWREYNQRKAELFREYGHGPEYDRALRDLIDELGV
jgi:hypothetical protein